MKYSDLWVRRDTEGERHIIEHIRRNGYISQETLGDICETHGVGDRVPGMPALSWRDWRCGIETYYPNVSRKYDPDF